MSANQHLQQRDILFGVFDNKDVLVASGAM
jgi:hypothetical protein